MKAAPKNNLNRHNIAAGDCFRKVLENTNEAVALLDQSGNTLYRSPRYAQLLGYEASSPFLDNQNSIIHPDDIALMQLKFDECLQKPGVLVEGFFYRIKDIEGNWRHFACCFKNLLHDEDVRSVIKSCRDVSHEYDLQNRQYELIKQTEERKEFIETVLQHLPIGVAVNYIDNGKAAIVNPRFIEIYGWPQQELADIDAFFRLVYPDENYRREIMEKVMDDIRSGDPERMSWDNIKIITSTGEEKIVNAKNIPIFDQNLMISTVLDMTAFYRQADELVESEKKYKYLFDNNPLPVLMWDFQSLAILDCNLAAEIKYGYTKDEFLQMTILDLRPTEDIPLVKAVTQTEADYGYIHRRIWRHKKKNGDIMYLDITGHLINFNGRRVSLTLSLDVTESRYYMQLDKLEKDVLEMNSDKSKSFKQVIENYLKGIEELHPGMLCSMQEKRGDKLYNIAAPSLPKPYLDAIEGGEINENAGSCGTAAFLKRKVIVSDIARDVRWKGYRSIALKNGLCACWSYPIMDSENEVMGTLASYFRTIRMPSQLEENTIERAEHILQVLLESYYREQALSESNERFEYVEQATSDIIWDWDLEKNTVYYSDKMTELFGHASGLRENNLPFYTEHVHPDDRKLAVLVPEDIRKKNIDRITREYRFLKADGNYAYVIDKGIVIRSAAGKPIRMVGAMRDVTHQKNEEIQKALLTKAVTDTLKERDTILERIADAFFAVDRDWTITYWNKIAERDLGLQRSEVLGRNLWKMVPEAVGSESYQKYHLAFSLNEAVHFEDYYPPLRRWYEISAYPSKTGLSVYLKNITERKDAEIKLRKMNADLEAQARELMISNNELEQFAYVASHDLQEPLRMVTSFLSLIERRYGSSLDDKGKKYIYFAVDGAKRMREIILDLLEFSRVGQIEEQMTEVDLNQLVDEVVRLQRKQLEEKKAKIVYEHLPALMSVRGPLRLVLQNLLSNAVKYSSPERKPVIHIQAFEQKTDWLITVTDNGIGIDKAFYDKIFIIFQRLHNREDYPGTGMGLAITKRIVEQLGGRIWVKSIIGEGSTFYFTILKR